MEAMPFTQERGKAFALPPLRAWGVGKLVESLHSPDTGVSVGRDANG